jgi:uncharacterized protein (DUF983 family)
MNIGDLKTCPKCGRGQFRLRYDRALDVIEVTCETCRYELVCEPIVRDEGHAHDTGAAEL